MIKKAMKILIVGAEKTDKYAIARELQTVDDDMTLAPVFTTDLRMKHHITDDFIYYMPSEEVELSYKNDAFMWVCSDDNKSVGVTKTDMYNANIFVMSFANFNNISNPLLQEVLDDGVICFVDSTSDNTDIDIKESAFACERIYASPYIYFLNDNVSAIVNTLLAYINGDADERERIAEEMNG